MKKQILRLFGAVMLGLFLPLSAFSAVTNPQVVKDLLNRVGGNGTASRFVTIVDPSLSSNGKETFVITSQGGKPCIKGSTTIAVTTGINWYLNHYAYVNIAWNQLTTDLSKVTLPVPTADETRQCDGDCRYYMNYCTMSYSCMPWTWERWQKEIDWMALHGINMPLQGVGMEAVWRNIMLSLGYTQDDVNEFVPGPAYQAWWLMGNLQGAGKPNPDWWYERQEILAKKILAAERAFGMKPVLPGFAGLVPTLFMTKSTSKMTWSSDIKDGGGWVDGFKSPAMTDPNSENFSKMAKIFYDEQKKIMGTSKYYSMDLCHEGSGGSFLNGSSANKTKACQEVIKAFDANIGDSAVWVAQHWLGNPFGEFKTTVPKHRAIVLDLYADATNDWGGSFNGHDMVFCMLNNFGGKVGMHGRLQRTISQYYKCKTANANTLHGVGATPEGIENNPMLFDALFEMPWRSDFNTAEWFREYAKARYGTEDVDKNLYPAWMQLGNSIYNYQEVSGLSSAPNQGPAETVFMARPNLTASKASSWGFCTTKGWDTEQVRFAAKNLLDANNTTLATSENYKSDAVEVVRQSLSDYAVPLLARMNTTSTTDKTQFKALNKVFLNLMLQVDTLLNAVPNCMVGKWTSQARSIADEPEIASKTTEADKKWLEKSARLLISTWDTTNGQLVDYSNRFWGGMIKDYYYPRWQKFLAAKENGTSTPNWYNTIEMPWYNNTANTEYPTTAQGDAIAIAKKLFNQYFCPFYVGDKLKSIVALYTPETREKTLAAVYYGQKFSASVELPSNTNADLYIDYNNDKTFSSQEMIPATASGNTRTFATTIPSTATLGTLQAKLVIRNGATELTNLQFPVSMTAEIPAPTEITIGNWVVPCTSNGDELTLQAPTSGFGAMDIPETYSENGKTYKIANIANGALQNVERLTEVSIPANVKSIGVSADVLQTWTGANKTYTLPASFAKGSSWTLHADVTSDGTSYNNWGSSLICNLEDAFAPNFPNAFQVYLRKEGDVYVNYGPGPSRLTFTAAQVGKKFGIDITYDGSSTMTFTFTPDGGTATTKTASITLNELSILSYGLPTGITEKITMKGPEGIMVSPFMGSASLKKATVAAGNANYSSADGILYDKAKTTLYGCPQANALRSVSIPASTTTIASSAFLNVTSVERLIPAASTPATLQKNALTNCTAFCQTYAENAAAYKSAWTLPILLSVDANGILSTATTTPVSVVEINQTDNTSGIVTAAITPTNSWLTRTFGTDKFTPVYLSKPATSIYVVGENGEKKTLSLDGDIDVYSLSGSTFVKVNASNTLAAGAYLMAPAKEYVNKPITFVTSGTAFTAPTSGLALLSNGTLNMETVTGNVYTYDAQNNVFSLASAKSLTVKPFEAYLKNFAGTSIPTVNGPLLTGIGNITTTANTSYYDLLGHKVGASAKGILISKGKKIIK